MGARSKYRKRAVDVLYEADLRGADAVTLLADRVGSPDVPPVNDYTIALIEGITANRTRIDDCRPRTDGYLKKIIQPELRYTDHF